MDLNKRQTEKGCVEYCDPDLRGMGVPVRIPAGFSMYRVCGNGACMNAQHMFFVDADCAHQIEIGLREVTLKWLRQYFKVDPETLVSLVQQPPPPQSPGNGEPPRIWLPRR